MIKLKFIRAVVAVSLTLLFSNSALASEINSEVLELAGQKKFEQALSLLSQQNDETRASYEHRFLKARILSWAGQYGEAEIELADLMQAYPGNPDLQLAAGNLQYYQSNFPAAETYYLDVLANFPDYEDAERGLENTRKAQLDTHNNSSQKWRIDGGASYSSFDIDDFSNWDSEFLRAEYTPNEITFHGVANRYNRFGLTDVEYKAGISDAVRGGWDWGLEAGFTPSADFRPDWNLGARLGRTINTDGETVFYPSVGYRYDDFDAGGIHNITPELTAYLDKGLDLTGRLIGTFEEGESAQIGWLVQARKRVSRQLNVNGGYAQAPETVNGIPISTKSIFGGLTYSVRRDFDLHLNLVRDDREDIYIRNSVNVGFTHKR